MATNITTASQVPYNSPGVYFREVDLTVVTQATGGFSAAAIGLTEKGPAFEITNSATYTDRAFRLGDLNPDFPTSYFAKQYLEQANNYKEVRVLGLEGYKDTVGYGITLAGTGSSPANITDPSNPTALAPGPQGLVCVLKQRNTLITGGAQVNSVVVANATYTDPLTSSPVTRATDYLFTLIISYVQPLTGSISPDSITVSLRPSSPQYIVKKFGTDPLAVPYMNDKIAPLWVDFIIPSVQSHPVPELTTAYYLPGSTQALNYLDLTAGETAFGTTFTFQNAVITNVTATTNSTTLTVGSDITAWLSNSSDVEVSGVSGTGNIAIVNGTWAVTNVAFSAGSTTFDLLDVTTNTPLSSVLPASTLSISATPVVAKYIMPTWENEILDFSNTQYQTPYTPWYVSDTDSNGHYKRLFRFWAITDGVSANTDIKIEITNINIATNNGGGSFDLSVRGWGDFEDQSPSRYETFANMNLDPTSQNYVLRRIGDGEEFQLRSRFIFIEMNTDEELPYNALPWGCLGYPNITGLKVPDLAWTIDYDKTKSITKQTLGLANNSINMNQAVAPSQLTYKSGATILGKGFHLNPTNNTTFASVQSNVFTFARPTIYTDINGNVVTPANQVIRNKFVVDFAGGFDGWNVYNTRNWADPTSLDYQAWTMAVDVLSDKESIDADFTILTTPDINFEDHEVACDYVLDMINTRGDCLYIPDFSYDSLADCNAAVDALTNSNMQSNNVAVYFPWLQISDTINGVNPWVPPSLLALGTITYVSTNENVWQPPGGSLRTITNNLIRSRRRLKIDDREILFTANINPITSFPGSGYEISGVRTTQSVFSALSFIHNRLLLCYAKKVLNQILRPLLFSLNNNVTQTAFINTVTPIFDRIKKLNGIDDFSVSIVDNSSSPTANTIADKTTLYGQITIVPLYPVERIIIDFVLQDGAITFSN